MTRRQSRRMSHAPRLSIITMAGEQEPERKHRVRECICNHVKSIVTAIMIFAMVFCIIMIVLVHKWRWESNVAEHIQGCLDVAIIGAGVSGSYAAYLLRDYNLRTHVFEATDRVGGKLYTYTLNGNPDIKIELGANHYNPLSHQLLNHTIHALKLQPSEFPPQNQDPPIYFLRDHLLQQTALKTDRLSSIYNLRNHERKRTPIELARFYMLKALANSSYWVNRPLTAITKDDEPLYQQGLWNLFGQIASKEGLSYLADTLPWRGFLSNENAASLGSFIWRPTTGHATLADGMQALPEALIDKFLNASEDHEIHLNRRLSCIKKDDIVNKLIFSWTETVNGITKDLNEHSEVCAHDVIVALPNGALQELDWKPLEEERVLEENMASVVDDPAIVAYFTYNKTWWRNNAYDEVVTDLPVRRVKYIGSHFDEHENPEYVFMVMSADNKDVEYFQGLLERTYYDGSVIYRCGNSSYFVSDVHTQIAEIYGEWDKKIPEPTKVIVQQWSGAPFGGWTFWKRGVHWERIQHRMLKPTEDRVYLVGNTFMGGEKQASIEGAMWSVEEMLNTHFRKNL